MRTRGQRGANRRGGCGQADPATERLTACADLGIRTKIPERREPNRRRRGNEPEGWQAAFRANRRRLSGIENVRKRYTEHILGQNLSRLMYAKFGIGTPRALQGPQRRSSG